MTELQASLRKFATSLFDIAQTETECELEDEIIALYCKYYGHNFGPDQCGY